MEVVCGIYQIKNTITGDDYVGQAVDIYDRFSTHRSTLRHQKHHNIYLQRAWNKYGEDVFDFIILVPNVKTALLDQTEQYFLDTDGYCVYNIAETASAPMRGRNHSPETRAHLSEIRVGTKHHMWGKHHSEQTKQKISNSLKGKPISEQTKLKIKTTIEKQPHPNIGKKHSEETKMKISTNRSLAYQTSSQEFKDKISIDRKILARNPTTAMIDGWEKTAQKERKPVERIDPKTSEIVWYESGIATQKDGFIPQNVSRVCCGQAKTHRGFLWRFAKPSFQNPSLSCTEFND